MTSSRNVDAYDLISEINDEIAHWHLCHRQMTYQANRYIATNTSTGLSQTVTMQDAHIYKEEVAEFSIHPNSSIYNGPENPDTRKVEYLGYINPSIANSIFRSFLMQKAADRISKKFNVERKVNAEHHEPASYGDSANGDGSS